MCTKFVWNYRFFVCQSHRPLFSLSRHYSSLDKHTKPETKNPHLLSTNVEALLRPNPVKPTGTSNRPQQQPPPPLGVVNYRQKGAEKQPPTRDEEKAAAAVKPDIDNMAPMPLFHPSKINMSSTPIKKTQQHKSVKDLVQADPSQASTPIRDNPQKPQQPRREFSFEHDTPIKGHKLKHLSQLGRDG